MNGYGSHWRPTATELIAIQKRTTTVCPMMYCGVPKKRAVFSAIRPKESSPKAPWCCCRADTAVEVTSDAGRR
jgi:hypothetical protein